MSVKKAVEDYRASQRFAFIRELCITRQRRGVRQPSAAFDKPARHHCHMYFLAAL
jgi:hypothetical protein